MSAVSPLLWAAAAFGVGGVAVLRFAWSLPRRSTAWNACGWGLLFASVVGAGMAEGAWGISVAALLAMASAAVALMMAGIRSPSGGASASNRRAGMLPEAGEPRRIGRRIVTFCIVAVAGFTTSIGLALAVRGLCSLLGWHEANSNTLALFTTPLSWAVLATVLLMQTSRRSQMLTLAACALPVVPVLLFGAI